MNIAYADLVKETTLVTGTGSATLAGAADGYIAFAARYADSARVPYCIRFGDQWEIGIGTMVGSTTLARTTVTASSNGDALVNFTSGSKDVYIDVPASELNKMATVDTITFATTIPLTSPGERFMPQQTVSSVLAFTAAASAVRGALVYLRLLADGSHAPTFTGMREWNGSSGYVNTSGILNIVQFFCDGTDIWYSIAQDANGAVEATAATAVTLSGPTSVVVNTASSNYTVGTNGTRSGSVIVTPTPVTNVTFTPSSVTLPAGTSTATFTATSTTTGAKTIAVTNDGGLTNPSSITLTVNAAATAPDAPTIGTATAGDGTVSVTFTAPASDGGSAITGYTVTLYKVSDNTSAGSNTGASSPISVTATNGTAVYAKAKATNAVGTGAESSASNSVTPAAAVYPRITSKLRLTESGAGPYDYLGTGGSFGVSEGEGVVSTALQSGVDGELVIKALVAPLSSTNQLLLGLDSSSSLQAYSTIGYGIVNNPSGYLPFTDGSLGSLDTAASGAVNDYIRIKRVGSTLTFAISTNSGGSYTTIKTYTGVSTGVMYLHVLATDVAQFRLISGSGLA